MHGHLSQDTPVAAPAATVWEIYRGLELGRLVDKLLPDVLGTVEVLEGDGGVGTVVKLTFPPGSQGSGYLIEKFTKIDDENRIKDTETLEGGYKDLGFDKFVVRLEIIQKEAESCIIRSSVEYELDEKLADAASHVSVKSLEIMAETIGKYIVETRRARS